MPEACPASTVLEEIAVGRPPSPAIRAHLKTCQTCRRTLRRIREDNQFLGSFAQGGLLPACLPPEPTPQIEIPGYRIEREIHQGGQGVVYQAVQLSTRRDVAIKVMKQGPFATHADRTRFDREIETLGGLNHPNIVAVHDAGMVAGFQYFVMNYVDGEPLDEAVLGRRRGATEDESPPNAAAPRDLPEGASPARIAETLLLFIKICDAVHAAHLRGVMHRDLKPSNIRVDRSGEPHVLDFGLAKPVDSAGEWSMTRTGQFVGSLPWASPEQVEGASSKIDLRTDVYSLGAILFQLLTGVLPFDVGSNLRSAVDKILFREPPRPSTLAPHVNDELDTIILKCLSKEPERRYQGAGELARDLRRYLAGEAIEAKRDSAVYMLRKTLRRYRLRVAVAAGFVVLLVALAGVMAVLYRRSAHLEQDAVRSAASLTDSLSRSNIEQGRMAGMLGNIQQGEQLLWRELLTRHAVAQESFLQVNDPPGPPEAFWGLWELYRRYPCLRSVAPAQSATCTTTASDDGKTLWTADADGRVEKVDEFGHVLDSYAIHFTDAHGWPTANSTGQLVLNREGDHVAIWRRGGDQPVLQLPPGAGSFPDGVTWSKSGRWMAAVVDGTAVVWSLDPPAEVARFAAPNTELTALALSNDDTRVAARDQIGHLYMWEIQSQRPMHAIPNSAPPRETLRGLGGLRFSPDDRLLADAWIESPGRIWNLDADPPTAAELQDRPGDHRVLAFSPDSKSLAIGDLGGALRIFDTHTGERRATFVAHPGRIRGVAFTGDGRGVWTFGDDGFRLWEVNPDAGIRVLRIEHEAFHSVDITPDGKALLAGGGLGQLHRVDLATFVALDQPLENQATISCITISNDGRRIAAATYANAAFMWDEQDRDRPPVALPHPNCVSYVCFSPDGARLATGCDDRIVRIWRVSDGQLEFELRGAEDRVPQVAFDNSGRRLAAAVRSGALWVWNLDTHEGHSWSPVTQKPLRTVQFSPDGRWLYAAGAERVVAIWDTQSRDAPPKDSNDTQAVRVAGLVGHNQEIYCLDVSSDGELLASGDSGGTIRLWHVGSRRPLATLEGHTDAVMAVHFARDGRALISASLDGTLRVWDLTYYARHIAGNVAVQLKRTGADQADAERAGSWTRWADSVSRP